MIIKTKTSTTRLLIKELHYKADGRLFEIMSSKNHAAQEPDREKVKAEMIEPERV